MFIDPMTLIGETLEHLELLSAFFVDESDERIVDAARLTPQAANSKAAARLCHALMPRLKQAAADLRASQAIEMRYTGPARVRIAMSSRPGADPRSRPVPATDATAAPMEGTKSAESDLLIY